MKRMKKMKNQKRTTKAAELMADSRMRFVEGALLAALFFLCLMWMLDDLSVFLLENCCLSLSWKRAEYHLFLEFYTLI